MILSRPLSRPLSYPIIGPEVSGTAPVNTVAPVASGTAMIGQTLTVTDGTWTGTAVITYTYQWRRDGVNIGGATANTHVVVNADLGADIDCVVTGTNAFGAASADSNNISIPISLAASVSSAVMDLDATLAASYPGTGTTWANLVAAPADGSAQTAYDMRRGDGATSTTYPTFSTDKWTFDGGDRFDLLSEANTAFLNALHKTTGGTDFWAAYVIESVDGSWGTEFIFSTVPAAANGVNGLILRTLSAENVQVFQSGASGSTGAQSASFGATPGYYLVILSREAGGTNTRYWINSITAANVAQTYDASSTDPTGYFVIGSDNDFNGGFLTSNINLVSAAMGNEYLDNTKAAAIIAQLEYRQNRDYTP